MHLLQLKHLDAAQFFSPIVTNLSMKFLKIAGIILAVIAALLLIAVAVLPSETHLERSTIVEAPADMIYQDLIVLKNFNKWSPWADKDPNIIWEFSGSGFGVGSGMSWISEDPMVGNGSMSIVDASYQQSVTYEMVFEWPDTKPLATVLLVEVEEGTKVTWTYDEEGIEGINKLFATMTDRFLGPDYELGLSQLKTRMESMPKLNYEMEVAMTAVYPYLTTKKVKMATKETITAALAQSYGELMTYINRNNLTVAGAPLAIYSDYSEDGFSFSAGIPVEESAIEDDKLEIRMTTESYALRATYMGDYGAMEPMYGELMELMAFMELEEAGNPMEEYVTDPVTEPNPANWLTYVYYPIK
jgi:effector-binding domain-containing protein